MKICIIRHGEACVSSQQDRTRHLTENGKRQVEAQGKRLKAYGLKWDKILVSPYARAQETFDEINLCYQHTLSGIKENWEGITPNGIAENVVNYFDFLQKKNCCNLLVISHLPLVGEIVRELCRENPVSFYPATMVCIDWCDNIGKIIDIKSP